MSLVPLPQMVYRTKDTFKQDILNYTGKRTGGQNPRQKIAANGPTVTPMSALAAEVEAVKAEDMEVGLDYWLPG